MKIFIIVILVILLLSGISIGLVFGLRHKEKPGIIEKTIDAPQGNVPANGIRIKTDSEITNVLIYSKAGQEIGNNHQGRILDLSNVCFSNDLTDAYYPIRVEITLKDIAKKYRISLQLINTCV